MTELLSPAGDALKLATAYRFGADAAYLGLEGFSLRTRSGSLGPGSLEAILAVRAAWPGRKLYLAANRFFHEPDTRRLDHLFSTIHRMAPDGIIVSDPGAFRILSREFPATDFHLSTQANCTNSESLAFYRDAGFRRVITGRECTLDDLGRMRARVPDIEIEVFVHGAMCMAISGRCFMSAHMKGRSANEGDCAHSCRWKFRPLVPDADDGALFLEESERPGTLFPLVEEDGYSTLLASRDLCMIDHVQELKDMGIHSLKIEGRMKSEFYVAMCTRAYRAVLDGKQDSSAAKTDLDAFSHREYCTGFFFGPEEVSRPSSGTYDSTDRYLGMIGEPLSPDPAFCEVHGIPGWHRYVLDVRNPFSRFDHPGISAPGGDRDLKEFLLAGISGEAADRARPGTYQEIYVPQPLGEGWILRTMTNPAPY